jgi:hypothetical protein
MDETTEKPAAWQPLTFGGVARFAYAPVSRLFLVLFIVAGLCGGVVLWFLNFRWVPQIEAAIARLPEQGSISNGSLYWPTREPVALAQNSFLSLSVQPGRAPELASGADVDVSFGARELGVRSFFGYLPLPYPREVILALNRAGMQPWWGAWKPGLLGSVGVITGLALLTIWLTLGALYTPVVKFLGFYADREVSWRGSWKCATASMLTAALLMCATIVLYSFQEISLLALLTIAGAHFIVQLVYVLGATMALNDLPGKAPANPFKGAEKIPARSKNPFAEAEASPEEREISNPRKSELPDNASE